MSEDPGPALSIVWQLLLLFVLVLLNAFFAMSEIAIISLNDAKIERMAEEGHKKAKRILKLTENSSKFLSTIQIGVTLAGFLTSASASTVFAEKLTPVLMRIPYAEKLGEGFIGGFSVFIITVLMSYFSLVLGELVPKKIAMQAPEKISFAVSGILVFISKILSPFIKILSLSTNGVVRLLGFDPNADEESVTEEEIRMMVDVGGEKGVFEDTQKEMINNIFEFDDIAVAEIMTHRTDMVAVDVESDLEEVVKLSMEYGYSRIPIYEEDQDDIIGIAYIKDLLKYIGTNLPQDVSLRDIIRKAYYVPDTKPCDDLFKELTENKVQMAIVVDEYGGTAGIVTMEDILESIVGNIQDEFDNEDEEISQIDEKTFTVDGTIDLDEVVDLINVELPEGEYDTLAGFIISILGFLPEEGQETVAEYKNIRFTVLNVEDRRIGKVKVEILELPDEEDDDEDDDDDDKKSKDKDEKKSKDKKEKHK